MDDLTLALADCRLVFPAPAAGEGTAWSRLTPEKQAEWTALYEEAKAAGTSPVLITSSQFEGGGSSSGQKHFDAKVWMKALLFRRGELDPDFEEAVFAPPALPLRTGHRGLVVLMQPGC